jgi:hypothetical protein
MKVLTKGRYWDRAFPSRRMERNSGEQLHMNFEPLGSVASSLAYYDKQFIQNLKANLVWNLSKP